MALVLGLAVAGCTGASPLRALHDPPPAHGPNILLIVTDQQRRNALGAAGDGIVRTPSLDRLAAAGIRFTRAYAADPECGPSRYAMFTSHYPPELGTFDNEIRPRPGFRYLPQYLNAAGYFTGSVGKLHFIPYGVTNGFRETYHHEFLAEPAGISDYFPWLLAQLRRRGLPRVDPMPRGRDWYRTLSGLTGTNPYPEDLTSEAWTTDRALDVIAHAKRLGRPFFVQASYFAPHPPYLPLPKYLRLYDPRSIRLPASFDAPTGPNQYDDLSADDFRIVIQHYYALVTQVDHQIGRLLDGLDALGVTDDTLVLFVSDHGDLMGEFRLLGKDQPYEGCIGVPFLMRWPGRIAPGQVSNAPVSLIDVVPTFLDAAGVPIPSDLRGRSVLPIARGEEAGAERTVFVVQVEHEPFDFVVAREGSWKLTCRARPDGRCAYRLVDLASDPAELKDRMRDPAAAAPRARLQDELERFWQQESRFVPPVLPQREPHATIREPIEN